MGCDAVSIDTQLSTFRPNVTTSSSLSSSQIRTGLQSFNMAVKGVHPKTGYEIPEEEEMYS
jgi:hypothetical protein